MKRSGKRIGVAVLLAAFIWILVVPRRPISFPVPAQNAYPDFLRAASHIGHAIPAYFVRDRNAGPIHTQATPLPGMDYTNRAKLEDIVSQIQEVYPIVSAALEKPCRVSVELSSLWEVTHHTEEIKHLNQVAHALVVRALLAQTRGQTEQALEGYIEAFRFTHAVAQGGLALDFLNSLTYRAFVLHNLRPLIPSLDLDQRRRLLQLIQQLEASQESPGEVATRTVRWRRTTYGLRHEIGLLARRLSGVVRTFSPALMRTLRNLLTIRQNQYQQAHLQPFYKSLQEGTAGQ